MRSGVPGRQLCRKLAPVVGAEWRLVRLILATFLPRVLHLYLARGVGACDELLSSVYIGPAAQAPWTGCLRWYRVSALGGGVVFAGASPRCSCTSAGGCIARTIPERGFGDAASMVAETSTESEERVGSFWDKYSKVSRKAAAAPSASSWLPPTEGECKAEETGPPTEQAGSKAPLLSHSNTAHEKETTPRTRLQCHLLLLGGTGTGKSTLLLSAKKLMPRVCTATGKERISLKACPLRHKRLREVREKGSPFNGSQGNVVETGGCSGGVPLR